LSRFAYLQQKPDRSLLRISESTRGSVQRQQAADPFLGYSSAIRKDIDLRCNIVDTDRIDLGVKAGGIVDAHACLARENTLALPLPDLKGMG
jgi:hypothetical protein